MTRRYLFLVGLVIFFATLACTTVTSRLPFAATPTAARLAIPDIVTRQLRVLDVVDTAVREQYLREDLDGLDWEAIVAEYRARIEAGLDEQEFIEAMRELAGKFPPGNARYLSRAERIEAETRSTGTFTGIGVYWSFRAEPEPRVLILAVIEDTPAERAGLRAHDAIYAVDGQPIRVEDRETIVNRIRGPKGTTVTLTVQTPGEERRDVTITRDTITAGDVLRGTFFNAAGIAYYRLPVVAESDLAETLAQDLDNQPRKPAGLILDLRTSRAIEADTLLQLLALFGDGEFGQFYTRTLSETIQLEGIEVNGSQTAPLVILVGPDTAAQAEILAGALQAAGRATVIGLPTPGDVELHTEIELPDGSRFSLITASFRLPDGTDLGLTGVQPDIRVEGDWDSFSRPEDDPALQAAIEELTR
ncbi:MAG: S41 family peptidase [Anaerolineales bacterium]|nr:S41 family peptidase [Anaerolineales bacterium]